jgi:WD40 repeat protein
MSTRKQLTKAKVKKQSAKAKVKKQTAKANAKVPLMKPSWKVSPISTPQEYVNSVAISADGSIVVAGTFYFPYAAGAKHSPADVAQITVGTFAWNAQGKLLWQDKFLATEGVYWVALSRDATWAASAGRTSPAQGFVYIYNAATGTRSLVYNPVVRVNMVAFSSNASYLVAGADGSYLFARNGTTWSQPQKLPCASGDSVVAIDISADGQWIVIGTFLGSVILVQNNSGVFGAPVSWGLSGGSIHWVAISADGSAFAAAGSKAQVLYFKTASFPGTKQPAWTSPLTGCAGCRSVALSDNGSLVSAVGNAGVAGKLFLVADQGASGKQLWVQPTTRNPNSTSMDSAGKYVTAADGYPDKTPCDYYLFDGNGNALGTFQTGNMSWPMQISANATAIAAGSDDSNVYYFPVT